MAATHSYDDSQEENVAAALRVFSEHGKAISSMIAYHVEDPSTAEDLYQDLFMSLVKRPIPTHIKAPLAYLWRAILVDHPFSDGNKRTALYVALSFAREQGRTVNGDKLIHYAIAIARESVVDVRRIARRLKNALE